MKHGRTFRIFVTEIDAVECANPANKRSFILPQRLSFNGGRRWCDVHFPGTYAVIGVESGPRSYRVESETFNRWLLENGTPVSDGDSCTAAEE